MVLIDGKLLYFANVVGFLSALPTFGRITFNLLVTFLFDVILGADAGSFSSSRLSSIDSSRWLGVLVILLLDRFAAVWLFVDSILFSFSSIDSVCCRCVSRTSPPLDVVHSLCNSWITYSNRCDCNSGILSPTSRHALFSFFLRLTGLLCVDLFAMHRFLGFFTWQFLIRCVFLDLFSPNVLFDDFLARIESMQILHILMPSKRYNTMDL